MKALFDTNVVLDVFQHRESHYEASARAIDKVLQGRVTGFFPAHAVPTLSYILKKHANREVADAAVVWLIETFDIVPCDGPLLKEASRAGFGDFEDAIVAFAARRASCDVIVTRNITDFTLSPVPALSPATFLAKLV